MSTRVVRIDIRELRDIVCARQAGRDLAKDIGFGAADQTRLATAISELTRNILQYAGTGQCILVDESDSVWLRVKAVFEDTGPGIANLDRALEYGYSTSGGLGYGLPATRKLVHDFDIKSRPGETVVTIALQRYRI